MHVHQNTPKNILFQKTKMKNIRCHSKKKKEE